MKIFMLALFVIVSHPAFAVEQNGFKYHCKSSFISKIILDSGNYCLQWGNALKEDSSCSEEKLDVAATNFQVGLELFSAHEYEKASQNFGLSWRIFESSSHTNWVVAVGDKYANNLLHLGKVDEAYAVSSSALKIAGKLVKNFIDDPIGRSLLISHATALRGLKKYDQAIPLYVALANYYKNTNDNDTSMVLLNDLAICVENSGKVKEAGVFYAKAATLANNYPGKYSSLVLSNHQKYLESARGDVFRVEGGGIRMPANQLSEN